MFNFLFNPNGRVSRKGIWLGYVLPYIGVAFVAGLIDGVMAVGSVMSGGPPVLVGPFGAIVSLFYLWPSIAVPVKRFHDRGMSGWWVLWFGLIVFGCFGAALASVFGAVLGAAAGSASSEAALAEAGASIGAFSFLALLVGFGVCVVQFVILYLLPGQDGSNRFGSDPRNGGSRASLADLEQGGSRSGWAEGLLADPARMAAAAKGDYRAKPAAQAAPTGPAAAPNSARGKDRIALAFGTVQQAAAGAAGPRPGFGRRGL